MKDEFFDFLDSEDFYNLMQDYRCLSVRNQDYLTERFQAVKNYIRANVEVGVKDLLSEII